MDIEKTEEHHPGDSVAGTTEHQLGLPKVEEGEVINISGHKQELERQFDSLSIISTAITTGNVWVALASTITVVLFNGGPSGILYEFITVSVLYWFVAASIAELASGMPSSAGVYHWATVTAGHRGRLIGYLAGWWNFFAWIFAAAVTFQVMGAIIITMAQLNNTVFDYERWQIFIISIFCTWIFAAAVIFFNRAMPRLEQLGGLLVIGGFFVSLIVAAVMPFVQGRSYASSHLVWNSFTNLTGYSSSGFAFLLGMLNGAFAVGVPDLASHLAEEMKDPSRNIPLAVLYQYLVGFVTGILYLIAIFYSLNDLESLFDTRYVFPLGEIYLQVTGTPAGAIGLLFLVLAPTSIAVFGCYLTASRVFWTLARDRATPFAQIFTKISPQFKVPVNSIILCATVSTVLGCIYVGNLTAFNAFTSSFIVLSMASYLAAILPNLLSKRSRFVPGHFQMKGTLGFIVNTVACLFMTVFIVIFCFPFAMPVKTTTMNYTCAIFAGLTALVMVFYFLVLEDYEGPQTAYLGTRVEMTVGEYAEAVTNPKPPNSDLQGTQ